MEVFFRLLSHLIWFCYMLHFTKAVLPLFQKYEPTIITEGLPPGSSYYTFKATDANPSHNITYSFDSKGSEWFNIDSSSGVAIVKKTIDKEVMTNLFQYKVFASDGFNNKAVADVNQQILDINDNPPVFTNLPKTININEDLSVGSSVLEVSATDADEGPFGSCVYSIESGDEEGIFDIPNLNAGKITLKKTLDYDEGSKQFVLGILAKNTASPYLNSTSVLTINVVNVDDLGAKFVKNVYQATIVKYSFVGTVVTKVQAEDRDALNATIHYKIYQETNPGNVYTINNNTGEMTVNGPLNIGTQLLVVTATSTNHPPAFTVVKVKVASMLNMSYIVSVVEGQSDVVIFNLDSAEQFFNIKGGNFSIIPSAQSTLFTMDGKNLKVGSNPLDRETREQYQLHIAVQKDGLTKGLVMVTVNVLDINDNAPQFVGTLPYSISISSNRMMCVLFTVSVVDRDAGLNGTVGYAITSGNEAGLFLVDSSGRVSLGLPIDRLSKRQYILAIQASDRGTPQRLNFTTLTININDLKVPEEATTDTGIVVELVILGIFLALNTCLLGYIIWILQNRAKLAKRVLPVTMIKAEATKDERREMNSAFRNIALEERNNEVADSRRASTGPASTVQQSSTNADYENADTQHATSALSSQTPHAYQALRFSSEDQSTMHHVYEPLGVHSSVNIIDQECSI